MPSISRQLSQQTIISVGVFAIVHRLNDTTVRKLPRTADPEDLLGNIQAIQSEARIYTVLGDDPLIAECLSRGDTEDYIDLTYYANGTLLDFIKKNRNNVSDELRVRWGEQIIEAVARIHECGVIHSDLALRQYLLDDRLDARLSDFCGSGYPGQRALAIEGYRHCLPRDFDQPSTKESDLFAMGITLYELWFGQAPYYALNDQEIEARYSRGDFADVIDCPWGDIVLRCCRGDFSSANEALSLYNKVVQDWLAFDHRCGLHRYTQRKLHYDGACSQFCLPSRP